MRSYGHPTRAIEQDALHAYEDRQSGREHKIILRGRLAAVGKVLAGIFAREVSGRRAGA